MISEKLFELAFAYKKTKLWKSVWDTEIFAVKLPDGEIGYCSVMGAVGKHCALGLYVGNTGFNSFRIVMSGPGMISKLNYHEFLLSQDCLQCAFENKDELSEEEANEARQYARRHGISLRGRNAFPHFVRYRPNYLPWFLRDQTDKSYLCRALAAAVEVAKQLESHSKSELGILPLSETVSVPLLVWQDGAFTWDRIGLPAPMPIQYPKPQYINDIAAAKLKRLKKAGVWECDIIRFPEPIQDTPDQAPYFPVILLAISTSTEQVLQPQISEHYDERPEDLLEKFAAMFLESQIRPAMLMIRSERAQALLEGFCERAGIRLRMCGELPLLDEAVDSLMEHLGLNSPAAGSFAEILDMLLQLDDSELSNLPDEIRQQFATIIEQENLPDELADELAGKLQVNPGGSRTTPISFGWTAATQSYVISVSCGKGCFRHIRISGADTLTQLHEAIQAAFDFDNDHAYAFFLDNVLWSERNAYVMAGIDTGARITDDYQLGQLGLTAGQSFKYLFDFGDEWVFQCKVLRILDEKTDEPAIVRMQGDPPEQY